VGFHCAPGHLQLFRDLVVFAPLQQKISNLLLPWAQPDRLIFHDFSQGSVFEKNTRGNPGFGEIPGRLRYFACKKQQQWLVTRPTCTQLAKPGEFRHLKAPKSLKKETEFLSLRS